MKKAAVPTKRWFAAWRTRPVAVSEVDPADCGTAYGLDLSFPPEVPLTRAAVPAPQGWRERWAQRRRAS